MKIQQEQTDDQIALMSLLHFIGSVIIWIAIGIFLWAFDLGEPDAEQD
ncbi:MAG: hypothetical protein O7D95_03130 [Betaproteobacteria bacterium]|nr:hypothetical protein [Betaproteobacteria bacterium]